MSFEAFGTPNNSNLNKDESGHVSREGEQPFVFDTLEKETGITIKILNKIHESPHLKKIFYACSRYCWFFQYC